jgi:hypothetical protein
MIGNDNRSRAFGVLKASMNKLLLIGLACGCLVFDSGCATSFYPVAANSDYYVAEAPLHVFRIYYLGDTPASEERMVDFALVRACHVARFRDYKYFAIINQTLSGSERTVYDTGTSAVVLGPDSSLAIKCFSSRPKGVFVFKARTIEAIIQKKYRPGDKGARL